MASTAPPAPVSLPSSPPVGVTWPDVCTTTRFSTVRFTVPAGRTLPKGLMLAILSVPRMSIPPFSLPVTRNVPAEESRSAMRNMINSDTLSPVA